METLKGKISVGVYVPTFTETDPTVPEHVKNITEQDIANWNSNTGGGTTTEYELPIASATTLGGVKIGNNLSIDENGVLSATSSSSGGGTTNYTDLTNKPRINGVELSGNKTLDDLGIQSKGDYVLKSELSNYVESDPTVPKHVKNITEQDIANWNSNTGGGSADSTEINIITGTVSNLAVPTKAGYKIDGRDVYIRRVEITRLPEDNNYLDYEVGFSTSTMELVKFNVLLRESEGNYKMLPVVHPSKMANQIACYMAASKIRIYAGTGAGTSTMSGACATIEFMYKN